MRCERCGHQKRTNPLWFIGFALNQGVLVFLLSHWHADHAQFLGIPDYFALCLNVAWWCSAIGGGLALGIGLLGIVLVLSDPDWFYSDSRN